MRWSSTSLFTFLVALSVLDSVFSAPISVIFLERRTGKAGKTTSIKQATLNAQSLKEASGVYRDNALGGSTYTKDTNGNSVKGIPTPKTPPSGMDADHVLEAQTVATALKDAGYKTVADLGPAAHKEVKDVLNDSKNMAFVDADVNRKKGQATRAAINGNIPAPPPAVKDYVKKTSSQSLERAKAVDKVLAKHGINANVLDAQKAALKKVTKRELSLDQLD